MQNIDLGSLFKHKGGKPFGFGSGPDADWKAIFVTTLLLIVLATALNIYMFIKVDKGEIFVVDSALGEGRKTLNIERLRSTVSYYENKALEFQDIVNGTSTPFVDPSL